MSLSSSNAAAITNTIANFTANSGAFATRLFSGYYNNPTPDSTPMIPLHSTFNPSPSCPYFYLFAGMSMSPSATVTCAFLSSFAFTNAGTPQTTANLYWGDAPTLAAWAGTNGYAQPFIVPYIGQGAFQVDSGFAGGCVILQPTYSNSGIATRWSAVCDQIMVTTTQLVAASADNPITVVHGIFQQPWGGGG